MTDHISNQTALLIIDVQKGFEDLPYWGSRNNLNAEENMGRLLQRWRATGRPVFHVQHLSVLPQSPLHPSKPGVEIQDVVKPIENEPVFQKSVNSAFIGTDLEQTLRDQGITDLVIVGLTTQHCVSTSTRMAGNLGFNTYLVSDATAATEATGLDGQIIPPELIHQTELALLNGEFATVIDTETLLKAAA